MSRNDLIHDWNAARGLPKPPQEFELFDETLRDGLQSPSVVDPDIEDKLRILELLERLGVQSADVALAAASSRSLEHLVQIARHAERRRLKIELNAAARTLVSDLRPVLEASQRAGRSIGVYAFIGSSPIRQLAEAWNLDFIRRRTEEAVTFAVAHGLAVAYVTEDTTRCPPAILDALFRTAIRAGAKRIVLCDTVGHATPCGTRTLVEWTRRLVAQLDPSVKLDWHGHNDRGLAVANAIAALEAGVQRVHGCGLGLGERVGNAALDLVILNLKLLGWIDRECSHLVEYVETVSRATGVPIPASYPLAGADAFRTATGVHAAAIAKAKAMGDEWLADRVYSSVPAQDFGREQKIEVGHMSGISNVRFWLAQRALSASEALCHDILEAAKAGTSILSEQQILAIMEGSRRGDVDGGKDARGLLEARDERNVRAR